MWRFGLAKKLRKILGEDAVLEGHALLQRYPFLTDRNRPQIACLLKGTEEISQVLAIAQQRKSQVVLLEPGSPATSRYPKGSILLDLTRMDEILEIDSANFCAVVQPMASPSALSTQ